MWIVEVNVARRGQLDIWKAATTSTGIRYEYGSKEQAEAHMRMTYGSPEHQAFARVTEVES